MRYTPEQLQALGINEADLAIFWLDEQANAWVPQPTTLDSARGIAAAQVDHFSQYQLGDLSSPSEAFLPTVQGWQVGLYNGAASFSYPIEVPAGPAGIKPNLSLSYSSASADGVSTPSATTSISSACARSIVERTIRGSRLLLVSCITNILSIFSSLAGSCLR